MSARRAGAILILQRVAAHGAWLAIDL